MIWNRILIRLILTVMQHNNRLEQLNHDPKADTIKKLCMLQVYRKERLNNGPYSLSDPLNKRKNNGFECL